MIEVKNLSKSYGTREAIKDLNFSIEKGEVIGFLGPNGAGKTTTMKIITGFMAASQGSVVVDGEDVFEHPIEVKKKIGYLPETPPVYGDMKVKDYLEFVAALRGVVRSEVKQKVCRALERTRLEDVQGRLIQNLSKGFRQRVGLAQALVSDPEILILDEPTVGLDPKQMAEIRDLILELRGSHTIVLSTHILSEVQASCERVIIINEGRIVLEDSLEGLGQKRLGQVRVVIRVRKESQELLSSLADIPGIQKVSSAKDVISMDAVKGEGDHQVVNLVETVAQKVIQSGAGLMEVRTDDMNLEEVFIQLTSLEAGSKNDDSKNNESREEM